MVRQQHLLHAHRLSTARTVQHPRATLTGSRCWGYLSGELLEQLQLTAQAGEAAAIAHSEQAVVAYLHEGLRQDMLQEPTQELLNRSVQYAVWPRSPIV